MSRFQTPGLSIANKCEELSAFSCNLVLAKWLPPGIFAEPSAVPHTTAVLVEPSGLSFMSILNSGGTSADRQGVTFAKNQKERESEFRGG